MELNGIKPFLQLNNFFFLLVCGFEGGCSLISLNLEGRVVMALLSPFPPLNQAGFIEGHLNHTGRHRDSTGKGRLQLECGESDLQLMQVR